MEFHENLQNLRKAHGLSQEQLAEHLGVSRQAVSKWESGGTYPETEKVIALTKLFGCSMDALFNGTLEPAAQNDGKDNNQTKEERLAQIKQFARRIALGVCIILCGVTVLLYALSLPVDRNITCAVGVTLLLVCVSIATPIFILSGLKEDSAERAESIPSRKLLNDDERQALAARFAIALSCSVALIVLGTAALTCLYLLKAPIHRTTLPVAILMLSVTVGATIIVYHGILHDKLIGNPDQPTEKEKEISDHIGAIIMPICVIIYLILGVVYHLWHPGWIIFPIGGLLCGVLSALIGKNGR